MITHTLYDRTLVIAKDYFGPAAERFINRQIAFHLHKEPAKLNKRDIPQLAEWVQVSIMVLTDDKELGDEVRKRILDLG